jgi:predicted protein tyrosine phosphatase
MTTSAPTSSTSSDFLPTVRNIDEARDICGDFTSVLTVGPHRSEVSDFCHPDHKIVTFDDITVSYAGYQAPTFDHVCEFVEWGTGRPDLLVHCHAGMSRSTSAAWGIAIANGFDPQEAYDLLKLNHPIVRHRTWNPQADVASYLKRRAFIPNELVLKHLEKFFGFRSGTLRDIAINGSASAPQDR